MRKITRLLRNKLVLSWALYDWANSVFSTTVISGFFPVFFKEFWSAGVDPTVSTAQLGFANSCSSALVALTLPFVGALIDVRPWKKTFLGAFTAASIISLILLMTVGRGSYFQAALIYAISSGCYSAACAIYDSLLPSVTGHEDSDLVSSLGYALGYLGGGLLFAINILMYLKPGWFGLDSGAAGVQWSFLTVGLWWLLFSLPLFLFVDEKAVVEQKDLRGTLRQSFGSLVRTCLEILETKSLLFFLLSYWLYIDGIYTVVKMAIDYGIAIGFEAKELIAALLVTQFVGFPSALAYSYLGERVGTRKAILVGLFCYAIIVCWACLMSKPWEFYCLAAFIGLVQGGVQALSRSYFLRLIPAEKSGEYFGLFNLVGKLAAIVGPALVGLVAMLTSSSRLSISSLLVLFLLGALLLALVNEDEVES